MPVIINIVLFLVAHLRAVRQIVDIFPDIAGFILVLIGIELSFEKSAERYTGPHG